jgi:phosphate transport system substrate-binding protein
MKNTPLVIIFFLLVSCGNKNNTNEAPGLGIQRVVKLKGSETIRNVMERFVNVYSADNPDVILDYSGGGSVMGIMAFNNNEADIAFISRDATPEETERLKNRHAIVDTFAIDGLSIIINVSNPIKQLSIQQLTDIYSGKIDNWKEVGGEDLRITLYSRDISSGTYAFFKNKVLHSNDYAGNDINLTHNEEIVNNVSTTKSAIGYVGLSYSQKANVKTIPIVFKEGAPAFFPNYQNLKSNNYLLKRHILTIYSEKADDFVKKVILGLNGEKAFKLINESGLVPHKNHFN